MASIEMMGITVEIGGDATKLTTALKGVNSEIRNTQSQLKDKLEALKSAQQQVQAQFERDITKDLEKKEKDTNISFSGFTQAGLILLGDSADTLNGTLEDMGKSTGATQIKKFAKQMGQ